MIEDNFKLDNPHVKELIINNKELPLIFLSLKSSNKDLYTPIYADAQILELTNDSDCYITKELLIDNIKKKLFKSYTPRYLWDEKIQEELNKRIFFKAIVVLV